MLKSALADTLAASEQTSGAPAAQDLTASALFKKP